MGAPVFNPDESEPFKRKPRNDGPFGNVPAKDRPVRPDASRSARLPDPRLSGPPGRSFGSSSDTTAEVANPPRKPTTTPKPRHALFEGDAAAIELRSRLAQTRGGALLPAASYESAPAIGVPVFGAALRFTGVVVTVSAVATAAGFLAGGVKLPFNPARIAAPSGKAEAPPTQVTLAPQLNASNRDAPLPAAQTAAIEQPGPPAALPLPQPPLLPQPDASEIAARPKLGAEEVRGWPRSDAERDALWRQFVIWRQQHPK
jgi:hypothetical protein